MARAGKSKYTIIGERDIPLYGGKLLIIFSNDVEGIKEHLESWDRDNIYATTWYDNYKGKQGYFVIFNFNNKYRKITHGVITHEVMHAVNMIAEQRGFVPSFENDEPMTYLGEWIADEIYKLAKKKGLKISINNE